MTSCFSKKSFEKEMVLKPLPSKIVLGRAEANQLSDYKIKLQSLDVDKILSQLKNNSEKDNFKDQIINLRNAYNKSVEKLQILEKAQGKNKELKYNQLKDSIIELNTIWKYIIVNFRI